MKSKRRIAEELCVLYHEAVRSTIYSSGMRKKNRGLNMTTYTLDEVDKSARTAFMAAARACIELDADAREYITAQFSKWREASQYHKKFLIPSPQHIGTLAARVRYLEHKAQEAVRVSRVVKRDDEPDDRRKFFVEERQLRGLARVLRRDPVDVLTEQPERFSREFLEHKGVWSVVEDLWQERQRS